MPSVNVPVVVLDDEETQCRLSQQSDTNPDSEQLGLTPAHLAYLIYTSGSTGMPKGVMVEHKGIYNLAQVHAGILQVDSSSRVLQFASFSFDASVSEWVTALANGACLVLSSKENLYPGAHLAQTLKQHQVSHSILPASALQVMDASMVPHNMTLVLAGETLPVALLRRWSGKQRLFNAYGPTEATICATLYPIVTCSGERVPIGKPIANTQVYILDSHLQPVPLGVTGELYVGGVGVARGYLNRPELTTERFIADPFSDKAGARMYRTGDLGRWLVDGTIEYLGRNDFQVKVRGFRIELGEIEARLTELAGVREAVVIAREEAEGDKRLVAYLVAEAGQTVPTVAVLREALISRLPEYMVPAAFMTLEALPLTTNGKLDRKALPAPDSSALAVQAYEAPQGNIEQQLAEVWQALLGLERVGRHDNFFALGGHSLLAVQLVFRLQQISGWAVTLRQLFNCPTICQLARSMSEDMTSKQHPNLMVVRNRGEKRPLFLIHPAGGEVAYAYQLAPWLSDLEMPIYGVAATIPLAGNIPDYSIQEMARDYIEGLRTIQPKGPYRLAGWSLGGMIAYEMAYQLMGTDETVEFLGLLDTTSDYQPQAPDESVSDKFDGASWLLTLLPEELSDHERLSVEQLAEEGSFETVLAYIQTHHLVPILPPHLPAEFVLRRLEVHHKMVVASQAYHYSPLPVKLTLFSAIGENHSDISLGWQGRLPEEQLDIISVPGTHQTMVELPNVKELGKAMQDRLIALEQGEMSYPEQHYNPLIPIQQGRPGVTPLFCFPGAAASVFDFYPLVQMLSPEIPVYGLQARGLDSELVPHSDVSCAAKAYLEAIRRVYPKGPYCLLGHSFGGWIAFEVALLLQQAGETVSQLIVVDSRVPHRETGQVPLLGHIEILMKLVSIYNRRLAQPLPLSAADFVGLTADQQREVLYQALVNAELLPAKSSPTLLDGIIRVFAANMATRYVPQGCYQGKLVLINAEDEGISEDRLTGWQALAQDMEHHIIPGNHMSMLELPSVRGLSELLEYSFTKY